MRISARFVYWMNVSLDLFIEREPGDHGGLGGPDWVRIDEPLHREFNARARAMSMLVEGRTVYEMMDPFWPNARGDASLPDFMREFGEIWTNTPKVLVSRTRTTAGHNTRIVGGEDAIGELAALRREANGDIGVGGANLATQLLAARLLDELLLFTHPAVLSAGRPLFDPFDRGMLEWPLQLDLLEQKSFDNGVTMHRYAVRGAS
jgi:dihydrofolate reductase